MSNLRVWNIINPPTKGTFYSVESPEEGAALISKMADEQLKQSWIHSNAFGLEVFEDGEWTDWYDDEGRDVNEAFRGVL
jgi:hypothetical protein